jgi:stage IV sporulation protein FB
MPGIKFKTTFTAVTILGLLLLGSGNIPALLMLVTAWGIHEVSHLLSGEMLGYQNPELVLTGWGGRMTIDASLPANAEAEYLIALSGPLANWLMVGGVVYLNWLGFGHPCLDIWHKVNFLLGTVNLIPALPLDGGRILHALLNRHFGLAKATVISKKVTLFTVVLLMVTGVAILWRRQGGSLPLLIGCYLAYHLAVTKPSVNNCTWQLLQHKKKCLASQGLLKARSIMVTPETFLSDALRAYGTRDYLMFYLMDRHQNLWLVSEEMAWQALIAHGFRTTFWETIKAGFSVNLPKLNS